MLRGLLDHSHDWRLVLVSLAVAMMAGFTGLSLTRGAQRLPLGQRKLVVSMAALALGGGIWSMHFVAMLGLQLPIMFYYDALTTLISALVAILIAGIALLILHFLPRSTASLTAAGATLGLGIPIMHYIGMSGMKLCNPVYNPLDVVAAVLASLVLGITAIRIAYGERGRRNIVFGTLVFGASVVTVHFLAMAGTQFIATDDPSAAGPLIGNRTLALLVTLSAFAISGAFLLTGITFAPVPAPLPEEGVPAGVAKEPEPVPQGTVTTAVPVLRGIRIPYEREGRTLFAESEAAAAMRAEGHYSLLFLDEGRFLCPWSISEAEARLSEAGFLRVHRSYLVNPRRITGFERLKDVGMCHFDGAPGLGPVPVSRSHLAKVREALGL